MSAYLDATEYETGLKITTEQKAQISPDAA